MEDKQIIIDGVDVSGCELYRNDNGVFAPDGTAERTELCYLTNDYCGNNPNCYYKRLKRKEQECEEFRKANDEKNELLAKLGCPTIATAKRRVFCLQEQLDQLKTELTRANCQIADDEILQCDMREVIEELKAENEELKKDYTTAKSMYDLCQSDFMELAKIKDNYKQTLTEIKEIAENAYCLTNSTNKDMAQFAKQILQKISECEVE